MLFRSVSQSRYIATGAESLAQAIKNKSIQIFGTNGFLIANIVHKQGESCHLASGQSYGQKYISLASTLGSQGLTESICANSYSSVLSTTSNFLTTVATKTYQVSPLNNNELILDVSYVRGGTTTKLSRGTDYEVVNSTITFKNFTPQAGDSIVVGIGY